MFLRRLLRTVAAAAVLPALSALSAGLLACGEVAPAPGPTSLPALSGGKADSASRASLPAALTGADFGFILDRSTVRQTQPHLDDATFDAKWEAALESPLLLLRSFPAAFHLDLAGVAPARLPAGEGLCFGDAHVGNFGFIRKVGKRLVYNDLDDSGPCPLAVDALRYLASVRLAYDDDKLTGQILDKYLDALKRPTEGPELDADLEPDWGDVAAHHADDELDPDDGDLIARSDLVTDVTIGEADAIADAFAAHPLLSTYDLVDVAAVNVLSGGSAGLRRYWALVDRPAGTPAHTLLELKEATSPAVEWGRHRSTLDFETRLETLKRAFWRGPVSSDNFYLGLEGRYFLVRDHFSKSAPDPLKLGDHLRQNLLEVEALELARRHRDRLGDLDKGDLRRWLAGSSQAVAERWAALFAAP